MADGHLVKALDELRLEHDSLSERIKKLVDRRDAVRSGIEALAQLLADSEAAANPVVPAIPPLDLRHLIQEKTPLWRLIHVSLRHYGPMTTSVIANLLLESGYETSSGNFANVIVTNLGTRKDIFERTPDGRWQVRQTAEAQIADILN
jgi:hypothetical protein